LQISSTKSLHARPIDAKASRFARTIGSDRGRPLALRSFFLPLGGLWLWGERDGPTLEREGFTLERESFTLAVAIAAAAVFLFCLKLKLKLAAATGRERGISAVERGFSALAAGPREIERGFSALAAGPREIERGFSALAAGPREIERGFSALEVGLSGNERGFSALGGGLSVVERGFSALVLIFPGPKTGQRSPDSPRSIWRPPAVRVQPLKRWVRVINPRRARDLR
jgi:hypothetical protein